MIYLDNAASTAVRPEVLDEVIQILSKQYGNPSSIHGYGRAAEKTINIARRHVATLIGTLHAIPETESNNMAIHGVSIWGGNFVYIWRNILIVFAVAISATVLARSRMQILKPVF